MRKLFIISAAALFLGFNAQAEVKPYVSGKVNYNFQDYDIESLVSIDDSVIGGSIALGISGAETLPLRTEFEFSLMSEAEDTILGLIDISGKVYTYMLNFYYDFYNQSNFIPYVGFGLGAATGDMTMNANGLSESDKETAFSWQVGVGSYYKLSNNLLADLGVKYQSIDFDGIDAQIINVSLGLRYNF